MTEDTKDMLILGFWFAVVVIFLALTHNDIPKPQTTYESHTVKPGETLSEIVEHYHGSLVKTLAEHPSSVVMPGEVVEVVVER